MYNEIKLHEITLFKQANYKLNQHSKRYSQTKLNKTCNMTMTMDYSLMSFEHFQHFQDFGQRPCTIALCLFKIFGIFGKSYKSIKNNMLYDHGLQPYVFWTFSAFSRFSRFWSETMYYSLMSFQDFQHFWKTL